MSLRNLRKLQNAAKTTSPEIVSEDEFEPLFQKKTFGFSQLPFSSESEEDEGMETKDQVLSPTPGPSSQTKIRNVNRKKKNQRKKGKKRNVDEVEACLKEVNDLLGPPVEPTKEKTSDNNKEIEYKKLMKTTKKYFSRDYDYIKLLGKTAVMEDKKKTERGHVRGCVTRARIVDKNFKIKGPGLGMSIMMKRDGLTYFWFEHNSKYIEMQLRFWDHVFIKGISRAYLAKEKERNNVEAILQHIDYLFEIKEYLAGYSLLEYCICVLQNATHPLFNITNTSIRLLYELRVNRPFFVAVLKYIHVHSLKAAHRAALECAKMLLNLDPSDPLAVLAIIDVLALRAREHQWLIDINKHWSTERNTSSLPNFVYSLALAQYHVAKKNKLDLDLANECLVDALLRFPQVAFQIMKHGTAWVEQRVMMHPFFKSDPLEDELNKLISFYATMVWPKFTEDYIMKKWFAPRVTAFLEDFDKNPELQKKSEEYTKLRRQKWTLLPLEVLMHFSVINYLAPLIIDEKFPGQRFFVAADPPANCDIINKRGIDMYNYLSNMYPFLYPCYNHRRVARARAREYSSSSGSQLELEYTDRDSEYSSSSGSQLELEYTDRDSEYSSSDEW